MALTFNGEIYNYRALRRRLVPHAGFDDSLLLHVSAQDRTAVRAVWDARRQRLLAELDEPLR